MPPMQSLLIANRGEIAIRVIRSAKELGLRTVAVYSELDRDSAHVRVADEAWNIGPAPSAESYLDMGRILAVAEESRADAVHPGYGFLAENAGFARAVTDAGLLWVGPGPEAIALMGDKISSRRAAATAGVESVPGSLEPLEDADSVAAFGTQHGYPLAIKASHGGGGKGLRVVREAAGVPAAFDSARREAEAYFGNPEVYVERYLDRPRHVEAQVIADTHGVTMFLGERDCTIQRRHQKLIEETPGSGIDDALRTRIGEAAVAVAKAAGYVNAGTVEFLLDGEDFWFLEMNTRIQVEHTVTEMVTGIDLVKEQLRIAMGEPLSFDAAPTTGHAIEFRINAEDPSSGFLPTPGTVTEYREPGGVGVRVDSGVREGAEISQYYDTLIAKLVIWGRDRAEAIDRGRRALEEFVIGGVATTIPAHLRIIGTDEFRAATHWTTFVEDELDFADLPAQATPAPTPDAHDGLEERSMTVEVGGKRHRVRFWAPAAPAGNSAGRMAAPRRRPPKLERSSSATASAGAIVAPMQGTIVQVYVAEGDPVEAGDPICVLEAMKMENEVKATAAGTVSEVNVTAGDAVSAGAVMVVVA
jgi:acetyl-CoA/propionyl-CoA carboxylase biotin carboxyl carrier protein